MKKVLFFVVGISILILTISVNQSCDKLKDAIVTDFELKPPPVNFDIPNISTLAVTRAAGAEVWERNLTLSTEIAKKLEEKGVSFDNVKGFEINKVLIKVKEPADYDVKGLVGIKIFLGTPSELYAEAVDTDGKNTLVFKIMKDDVKKFLKQDKIDIKVTGPALKGDIPSVNVDLSFVFKIEVSAL